MKYSSVIVVLLVLGGCAQVERVFGPGTVAETEPEPEPVATEPRTAETLDRTTEADREAARAEASSGQARSLGATVASLGSPAEPGLWLKTPLVDTPERGRVDYAATGQSVAVDLIPLNAEPGAGSQLSLAGFRAVGASLTALPELQVYRLAQ